MEEFWKPELTVCKRSDTKEKETKANPPMAAFKYRKAEQMQMEISI
jgi:hypothetical protein